MAETQIRRIRTTLLDQFSLLEPNNLRDLLKLRDDEDTSVSTRRSNGIVTLASILESEKHGGRTLLDIIREEDESRNGTPESSGNGRNPSEADDEPALRVSLMTLLALADGAGGEGSVARASGSGSGVAVVAVAEEEGGEDDVAAVAAVKMVCCVCMTRRKGAAFIPCGHTFCRICSRELFSGRGFCPLCNATILDVLDIF